MNKSRDKKKLHEDIILKIVNNENLISESENSLFEMVFDPCQKDKQYKQLFEYVIFKNISEENIFNKKFINNFDIEHLNLGIWRSIF